MGSASPSASGSATPSGGKGADSPVQPYQGGQQTAQSMPSYSQSPFGSATSSTFSDSFGGGAGAANYNPSAAPQGMMGGKGPVASVQPYQQQTNQQDLQQQQPNNVTQQFSQALNSLAQSSPYQNQQQNQQQYHPQQYQPQQQFSSQGIEGLLSGLLGGGYGKGGGGTMPSPYQPQAGRPPMDALVQQSIHNPASDEGMIGKTQQVLTPEQQQDMQQASMKKGGKVK